MSFGDAWKAANGDDCTIRYLCSTCRKELAIESCDCPNPNESSCATCRRELDLYFKRNADKYGRKSCTLELPPPETLIVAVQRFSESSNGKRQRLNERSDPPLSLEIGGQQYQLKAVLSHKGQHDYGHYIAFVLYENGQWWRCDDDCISTVRADERYLAEDSALRAYIFAYERSQ